MIISTNVQALTANNALWHKNNDLITSSSKLSSGLNINKVGDDACGMAIANKMRRQIQGLESAERNTTDAISLVSTAEGGMAEIQNIVQRVRELAVQGATDALTDHDRTLIQVEAEQLLDEIDAIVDKIEFNSKTLLNDDHSSFTFQVGTNQGNEIVIDMPRVNSVDLFVNYEDVYTNANGDVIFETSGYAMNGMGQYIDPNEAEVVIDVSTVGVQNPDGSDPYYCNDGTPFDASTSTLLLLDGTYQLANGDTIDVSDRQYVQNDDGDYINTDTADVIFDPDSAINDDGDLPILSSGMTLLTVEGCTEAIKRCDYAVTEASKYRATLGTAQNRLEQTQTTLITAKESTTISLSSVVDTDMAAEMAIYTKENVLVQAGISMLAQANQRPNQVLTLLQ